ncbi:MAG: hypothetical protein J6R59_00005 [Paludibacteraceae bacterium]|nr:hypothetical protein [Paludibacteraceae bacterium]
MNKKNTKEEKVRKEVVSKVKRKLTDKSTEKPVICGIWGCYKNYSHRPLG